MLKKSALIALSLVALVLLAATAPAQQGAIYGIAIGQDGQPAKGMVLAAKKLATDDGHLQALCCAPPGARTNQNGEYRIERLPFGTYIICADDERAGYALYTCANELQSVKVRLTAEHPEQDVRVNLPPRDGLLDLHVTDQESGAAVSAVTVVTSWTDEMGFTTKIKATSHYVMLIPPDREILLHVSAPGFREWQESVGTGKPIRVRSGARLQMDVQLTPLVE